MAMSRGRKVAFIVGGVLLGLVLIAGIFIALLVMALDDTPNIRDNSVLVLRVEGSLPDYAPADPAMSRLFGSDPNTLSDLLLQLRKAKSDKRIGAVLLDIG